MLLHLHGVCPVGLALEDEDLEVLGTRSHQVRRDGLLNVDVFLVLALRLRVLQVFAQT